MYGSTFFKVSVLTLIFHYLFISHAQSQVGINTDGSVADSSAILDIKSSDKGILIPRMTSAERMAIQNPAIGLMVYDSVYNSFWYYHDNAWHEIDKSAFISRNGVTHSTENNDDFVFGGDKLNFDTVSTEKFFFDRSKRAFRAGKISSKYWDTDSLGVSSVAFGSNTLALGFASNAFGNGSQARGSYAVAFGQVTKAIGNASNAFGSFTKASGATSTAFGSFSEAQGVSSTALGNFVHAASFGEVAIGSYNTIYTPNNIFGFDSNDRLFVIGNGLGFGSNSRRDALIVRKSGDTEIYGNVGIHTIADSSAILDISSTEKGILIPRMTSTERSSINNPADGLLVYDTLTDSFWYYANSSWIELISSNLMILSDTDGDTNIQVEENADEDIIRFDIAGSEGFKISNNSNGRLLLETVNNNENLYVGELAGQSDSLGGANVFLGHEAGGNSRSSNDNVFIGKQAGLNSTSGDNNVFIGSQAGINNSIGDNNTIIGREAGRDNNGYNNLMIGRFSGYKNVFGSDNIFLGNSTGFDNETGSENIYIGSSAGENNVSGQKNVFLGFEAGKNETGSNRLYIENSDSPNPLIYGDFANDTVRINGTLDINNNYSLPNTDGISGQIMTTDGSGNLTWNTPSTTSLDLSDNDGDTKVEVEKNTDEDIIRFMIDGTEGLTIQKNDQGRMLLNTLAQNSNVYFGSNAGLLDSSGQNNTYIGVNAGRNNTSGKENTFVGSGAGSSNTEGRENVFVGSSAGASNSSGRLNTFFGHEAGNSNQIGNGNVYMGFGSGKNSNANENVFIGNTAERVLGQVDCAVLTAKPEGFVSPVTLPLSQATLTE